MKDFTARNPVQVVKGQGGLPKICIQNDAARAEVCLMGAHVLSYCPAGQEEVLFLSEHSAFAQTGPAIRGGVPVCWPWFGPADIQALPHAVTSHGFARQCLWELIEQRPVSARRTEVTLMLHESPESLAVWPHPFELRMNISVGATLEMNLETVNTGETPFTFAQALHSYFSIGDVNQIRIKGLDGLKFIDKAPGNPPAPNPQRGEIAITEETDRIYLGHAGQAVIVDPVKRREIVIDKSGSRTSVVWNPWIAKSRRMPDFGDEEFHRMLCVETCNVAEDSVLLAPGERHALTAVLFVRPIQ
ncbi:MAG: D-hexose-6-phosphate mutarotase [Victivallales bacterium]|nr:D-hexose-6-phosphate mutarotase [Victivallales bacterium]